MRIKYVLNKIVGIQRRNLCKLKNFGRLVTKKRVSFDRQSEIIIEGEGKISIDEFSIIGSNSHISAIGGSLRIGKHTYLNRYVNVVCRKSIEIGSDCAIGPGVVIYDHDHKFGKNGWESGFNLADVTIGDHCWIGANVTILRGTHIGKNCVIGAGCMVKGDIPDNTLVVQDRTLVFKKLS